MKTKNIFIIVLFMLACSVLYLIFFFNSLDHQILYSHACSGCETHHHSIREQISFPKYTGGNPSFANYSAVLPDVPSASYHAASFRVSNSSQNEVPSYLNNGLGKIEWEVQANNKYANNNFAYIADEQSGNYRYSGSKDLMSSSAYNRFVLQNFSLHSGNIEGNIYANTLMNDYAEQQSKPGYSLSKFKESIPDNVWVEEEYADFGCPKCGGTLIQATGKCTDCDYEWFSTGSGLATDNVPVKDGFDTLFFCIFVFVLLKWYTKK